MRIRVPVAAVVSLLLTGEGRADPGPFVTHLLIVQLPIDGDWGTDRDLRMRHALEKRLQRRLGKLGFVDGGDIGSGTMNLFVVDITDPETALLRVNYALERGGLIDRAVIQQTSFRAADDPEPVERVVWPPDYQGTFSVL